VEYNVIKYTEEENFFDSDHIASFKLALYWKVPATVVEIKKAYANIKLTSDTFNIIK
jgi:hypothetical protein